MPAALTTCAHADHQPAGTEAPTLPPPPAWNVLVVDDSASLRAEVRGALEAVEGVAVTECGDGFSALRAMVDQRPDVVLLDLVMPGCDGISLLRLVGKRPELASIPIIMLTSADDIDGKVAALERGAADYVVKPFHRRELAARVRTHLRLRALQEELEKANERLRLLSCTDALTGLFNRRRLDEVLDAEVARAARYGSPVSVMMIDVDHFKSINDRHGHAVGDDVLRSIGAMLREHSRKTDVAARFGGEELSVVLGHTPQEGAAIVAERVRRAIEETEHTVGGETFRVTASLGVAGVDGERIDAKTLLGRADAALYQAKRRGRNRVEVA